MKQYKITYKDGSTSEIDYIPSTDIVYKVEEREVTEWHPVARYSVYYTVGKGEDTRSEHFQFWAGTVEEALTKVINLVQSKAIKSCKVYKNTVKILDYASFGVGE